MQRITPGGSRWRRTLPWFGGGGLALGALVGGVAAALVPADAPAVVVAIAAEVGLVTGLVVEFLTGLAIEAHARTRRAAEEFAALTERAPRGFAAMLSPHHAAELGLPFHGRQDEVRALLAWCTSTAPDVTPFRLLTGPGGVGKTRLADELQRRLRAQDAEWRCLFLSTERGTEPGAVAGLRQHAGSRPLLVIVDYAENRPGLRSFLRDAFEDPGTIRVLLLARAAGEWWHRLTAISGGLGAALHAGYTDEDGNPGADLPDVDVEPHEVVAAAARVFADRLGVPAPPVAAGAGELRVLDLTALALVEVLGVGKDPHGPTVATPPTPGEVFTELLRHEASGYWAATAAEAGLSERLPVAMQQVLVAAVALLGTTDEASTIRLVERVLGTFTEDPTPDPLVAARWLRKTYLPVEGTTSWVEPLAPDRVAEHLVVQVLTRSPGPVARRVGALLEDLTADQAASAMTLLWRAGTDPMRDQAEQEAIRALADHLVEHLPAVPQVYHQVLAMVPWPSAIMTPTAGLLAQKQHEALDQHPDDDTHAQAALLLGNWFMQLGRRSEALPPTQRAVDLYEQLAQEDPERYGADLASALNDLGVRFYELGRTDEALPPTQRAVDLREQLAHARPDRFDPDLARSLINLGIRYSELGRPEEGLRPTRRAVDLYEQLARTSPVHYDADLARALINLGLRYAELGRSAEALPPVQRAVEIRERLARSRPDRYNPELARSLTELGIRLTELGRPAEALPATRHAVDLHERLVDANPDRYEPDLSRTLTNLGTQLAMVGRSDEAVPHLRRAVEIRERFARTSPDRYNASLAKSLTALAVRHLELGRPGEALPPAQRAVDLYQALVQTNPDRYEPDLARTLGAVGKILGSTGRRADAINTFEDADVVFERVERRTRGRHRAEHQRLRMLLDTLRDGRSREPEHDR
jgi:tetratricopeptide (TPR) repeat protein